MQVNKNNITSLKSYEFVFFKDKNKVDCIGLLLEKNIFTGEINYLIEENNVIFFDTKVSIQTNNLSAQLLTAVKNESRLYLLCIEEDEIIPVKKSNSMVV